VTELDYGLLIAAWLTGLAGGSGHCIGMCGGIVGALGVGQRSGWRGQLTLLGAHLGRICGYACAGGIVGYAGAAVVGGTLGSSGLAGLRIASAVLILLIGLQLLIGRPLLGRLERGGAKIWRLIAPVFRSLLPPRTALRAFAVGALWAWLPCGLVYAQLTVAAASGSWLQGALSMAAFGLGTTVSLSAVSALLQSLGLARLPRQASGVLLVLFAVWTVLPLFGAGHMAHH
jgi:sulfite exporter TauE/SafE